MTSIPRPEYPRPQFVREDWINLNGPWSYTFDFGKSGMQRGWQASSGFCNEIIVPFCPESKLSGVGHTDFIEMMWYHRKLEVPAAWDGMNVILHFGGVDFESEVFIDGRSVGSHWGGTVGFCYDITRYVEIGAVHDLVVYVRDDTRTSQQPGGKQCPDYASRRCHYTRTTGIWQTVWMEAVSPRGLKDCAIVPDLDNARFALTPRYYGVAAGQVLRATLVVDGQAVVQVEAPTTDGATILLDVPDPRPWSPEDPYLYDIVLAVRDGLSMQGAPVRTLDAVRAYAGLRKVHVEGNQVFLNNAPLYQRLVLDQGFYPDGIWTAPTDADLKADIELSMAAGFNGARLHQKVFEERFHYWADKLGYLTWGESSSWGLDVNEELSARNFLEEWREILVRDRNHPSIIAWTPLNETRDVRKGGRQHHRLHVDAYRIAKDVDPTRPVNDASGYVHIKTDLWTVHTYEQDPAKLAELLALDENGDVWRRFPEFEVDYTGQPYLVDEFGGIKWIPNQERVFAENSWGYGADPTTLEEFYARLEGQVRVVLDLEHCCGFCYTQLTDVEQEQNGVYNYDRSTKFDMARIKAIFQMAR